MTTERDEVPAGLESLVYNWKKDTFLYISKKQLCAGRLDLREVHEAPTSSYVSNLALALLDLDPRFMQNLRLYDVQRRVLCHYRIFGKVITG